LLASPVAGLASGRLSTVIFFGALVVSALINAAVISLVDQCGFAMSAELTRTSRS
jgi:hypothetical protein